MSRSSHQSPRAPLSFACVSLRRRLQCSRPPAIIFLSVDPALASSVVYMNTLIMHPASAGITICLITGFRSFHGAPRPSLYTECLSPSLSLYLSQLPTLLCLFSPNTSSMLSTHPHLHLHLISRAIFNHSLIWTSSTRSVRSSLQIASCS